MSYEHILNAISSSYWAILPAKLSEIIAVVQSHERGVVIDAARWEALAARRQENIGVSGGVATIGLYGTISQRVGLLTGSGGTSTEEFGRTLQAAMDDPDISAVVVDIDSPGGSVYGVQELSDRIYSMRGKKPLISVSNSEAFSAAYWLASAFDKLYVTPSGQVGSVGVIATHADESAAIEREGVKYTFVTAGKYKAEGNSTEPLSEEAHGRLQQIVDTYYSTFVGHVARNRGVTPKQVEESYGQGRTFTASEALSRGMVDGIKTLDQVRGELSAKVSRSRKMRAERSRLELERMR